eukprot:gene15155-18522_t
MCDYFSEAFMLSKKALQRALLLLVPVITSLSLNVLLLPKFGLMGSAYANVAAYGLGMTMLAWIGRRYVALPIPLLETAKIAIACVLMAGVVLALPSFGAFQDLILKGGLGYVDPPAPANGGFMSETIFSNGVRAERPLELSIATPFFRNDPSQLIENLSRQMTGEAVELIVVDD